jgi:hypothetical protein
MIVTDDDNIETSGSSNDNVAIGAQQLVLVLYEYSA